VITFVVGTVIITNVGTFVGTFSYEIITTCGYVYIVITDEVGTNGTHVVGTITGLVHVVGTITVDGTDTDVTEIVTITVFGTVTI
jgi:hypothetical protein